MSREPHSSDYWLNKEISNSLAQEHRHDPVSSSSSTVVHRSFLHRIWSSACSKSLLAVKRYARRQTRKISGKLRRQTSSAQHPATTSGDVAPSRVAIDILPDELLLEIFACYVQESQERDTWHTLAFVCRRWRGIALGSPNRLNIRIFCSERKHQ